PHETGLQVIAGDVAQGPNLRHRMLTAERVFAGSEEIAETGQVPLVGPDDALRFSGGPRGVGQPHERARLELDPTLLRRTIGEQFVEIDAARSRRVPADADRRAQPLYRCCEGLDRLLELRTGDDAGKPRIVRDLDLLG